MRILSGFAASLASRSSVLALMVLATAWPAAGQEPPTMIGLPMEAVEHLPGVPELFQIRNASATPTILVDEEFRLGELVARFYLDLSDDDVLRLARRAGAARVVRKSPLGLFLVKGPASVEATERVMSRLWETGKVVSITPNYVSGGLTYVPNDPHHVSGAQWYHQTPSDIDLDLPDAWEITRGSPEVVVAVMDTGIVVDHPEFAGRLWVNSGEIPGNGIDDDGNGYVDDINGWNTTAVNGGDNRIDDQLIGHGTYVTSILLANGDNSRQIAGFDHSAKVLTVRAIIQNQGIDIDQILAAFDYLTMNPVFDILNMSWASGTFFSFRMRLDALAQSDVLMFAGSGNTGTPGMTDNIYPASHPDVIAVSGTDNTDALASFSDTGNSVDFSAPAVDIVTASWADPFGLTAFHLGDGTSFACPMPAATASLGLAVRPAMTKRELIFALKETAVDLGPPGWDSEFGWGRINTHKALLVLENLISFDDFETGDLTSWSSSSP